MNQPDTSPPCGKRRDQPATKLRHFPAPSATDLHFTINKAEPPAGHPTAHATTHPLTPPPGSVLARSNRPGRGSTCWATDHHLGGEPALTTQSLDAGARSLAPAPTRRATGSRPPAAPQSPEEGSSHTRVPRARFRAARPEKCTTGPAASTPVGQARQKSRTANARLPCANTETPRREPLLTLTICVTFA